MNTYTTVNYLQWIELMEAFYTFKKASEKITFYPKEIKRMEQSIMELKPNIKR